MIGIISVIMIFSIPIIAIISGYLNSQAKIKAKMLTTELELEKVKQQNFIVETEKMRLELQKMQLDYLHTNDPILLELQKEKAI
ncbi:MAG: hypothetical protein ABWX61_09750 [Paenisporosarcina sp.]